MIKMQMPNIPTYVYAIGAVFLVIGVVLIIPKFRRRIFEGFRAELYQAGTAKNYDLDDNRKLSSAGPQEFGLYNDGDIRGEQAYFEGDVNLDPS